MAVIISGPGLGLPFPQNLYPSDLTSAPIDCPSNHLTLSPGDSAIIPAGNWIIEPGSVSLLQYLDPVSGVWRAFSSNRAQPNFVTSDGFTRRVANLTACPVSAVVVNGGSGFANATATVTANTGGSMWNAVVGGSLSVSTITAGGSGYSLAPLVYIPAPPAPGIAATGYATITAGVVTGITLTNFGSGYGSAPKAVILPNPADANAGAVTQASVTLILNAANATAITGVYCTNNGAPLASLTGLTLTAAGGAGTGATITPVIMQTIVSATVTGAGTGFGTVATPPVITTAGGVVTAVSAIVNPSFEMTSFRPRPAIINVTSSGGGAISAPVITDPGLFVNTATPVIIPGGTVPTAAATVAFVMGGRADSIFIQPL